MRSRANEPSLDLAGLGAISRMSSVLKRVAAFLPIRSQQVLKRLYFAWQVRRDTFSTDEPEFAELAKWVDPGDWAIDIGANVGHYTLRLARLVGDTGRVLALEPQPQSFEILASNLQAAGRANVTLLNLAASDRTALVQMTIPTFETGLRNYYMARLSDDASTESTTSVLSIPVDSLDLPHGVKLVKIDAEGHELQVIHGMKELLRRDRPRLIVEVSSGEVVDLLRSLGYRDTTLANSPNRIFEMSAPTE